MDDSTTSPNSQPGDGRARQPSITPSTTNHVRRMRARKACEPCRERKRKCDGGNPCSCCVRYEYDCYYFSVRERRGMTTSSSHRASPPNMEARIAAAPVATAATQQPLPLPPPVPPVREEPRRSPGPNSQLQSLEANSGAAFVRKLALGIDPANAPRLHLFAWNLFLGARTSSNRQPLGLPVTEIISRATMEGLMAIYIEKVDPCYGFVDRVVVEQRIQARWDLGMPADQSDAVLCGIAAMGLLFSQRFVTDTELDLIESAKRILEASTESNPGIDIVTGWVLRVAYLRMTASPHTAWMASCTLMHTVEAAGIHSAHLSENIPGIRRESFAAPELCRRLFGVARHLNVWMSFDLGRSRVILQNATHEGPSSRQGDSTAELLSLLPWSESLDPGKDVDLPSLKATLSSVLDRELTIPSTILAHCNLVLCLCRRLRALDYVISGRLLDRILALTAYSIQCAQANLDSGSVWHHTANVPFQIVCILLAFDTPSSIAQLGNAIGVLKNAAQLYETDAAREACNTACLLVLLHQKRKEADTKSLSNVLQAYSPAPFAAAAPLQNPSASSADATAVATSAPFPPSSNDTNGFHSWNDSSWLDDLMTDMPNLQGFDIGQILDGNSLWDTPGIWS